MAFTDMLRILRWRDPLGLPEWILNVIISTTRERQSEIRATEKRIKQGYHRGRVWSEVATNPGVLTVTRRWKRQGTNPRLWWKCSPADTCLVSVKLISIFRLLEL